MANTLVAKIEFKGSLVLKTGLHIGGTNSSMSIGGIDKGVIRNPLNNQPYVPGSSLKGKLRSLYEVAIGASLERSSGQVPNGPSKSGDAAQLFGNATGKQDQQPSRVIVRDAYLDNADELLKHTEIPYTEGKTEVVIDRITSAAMPRQIERVPAGAKFALNIVLDIWSEDKKGKDQLIAELFKSMELLADDYLGGQGSRGYGQVSIEIEDLLEKRVDSYYGIPGAKAVSIKEKWSDQIEKLKG